MLVDDCKYIDSSQFTTSISKIVLNSVNSHSSIKNGNLYSQVAFQQSKGRGRTKILPEPSAVCFIHSPPPQYQFRSDGPGEYGRTRSNGTNTGQISNCLHKRIRWLCDIQKDKEEGAAFTQSSQLPQSSAGFCDELQIKISLSINAICTFILLWLSSIFTVLFCVFHGFLCVLRCLFCIFHWLILIF